MSFLFNKDDTRIFFDNSINARPEDNISTKPIISEEENLILRQTSKNEKKTIKRSGQERVEMKENSLRKMQEQKSKKLIKLNKSRSSKVLTKSALEYFLQKIIFLLNIEKENSEYIKKSFFEKILVYKSVTLTNYLQQLFLYIYQEKLQKEIFLKLDEDILSSFTENNKSQPSSSMQNSSSKKEDYFHSKSLKSSSSKEKQKPNKSNTLKKLYFEIMFPILKNEKIKLHKKEAKDLVIFMCKIVRQGILKYHHENHIESNKMLFIQIVKMCTKSLQIVNKKVDLQII
jgi:hypothetical protein